MSGTAGEADCHVRALPFLAMTVITGSLPLLLVLPQMIGTAVPRMSLRTSPQTGVAIRPPFGTTSNDRNCRGSGLPRQGFALPRNDSCKTEVPSSAGTAVLRVSLRTSPQTGVAIRSPFGTAPDDRNCS